MMPCVRRQSQFSLVMSIISFMNKLFPNSIISLRNATPRAFPLDKRKSYPYNLASFDGTAK